jgi:hypothetical protein
MLATNRRQLSLSDLKIGKSGADYEDLRWYFQDFRSEASGARSSFSSFVARLEGLTPAPPTASNQHVDARRRAAVRKAQRVESKLRVCSVRCFMTLSDAFDEESRRRFPAFGPLAKICERRMRHAVPDGSSLTYMAQLSSGLVKGHRGIIRTFVSCAEATFAEAMKEYRGRG